MCFGGESLVLFVHVDQFHPPISVFHLLTEESFWYCHLGDQEEAYEQTIGSGPGHAGPADLEDSGVGTASRLGDQPAFETDLWRRAAGQRRIALSGPPQVGAGGMDQGRVEAERE